MDKRQKNSPPRQTPPLPVYIIKQNFSFDIRLVYCGIEQDVTHRLDNRVNDCYVMTYITKGQGSYHINGKDYCLKKGDLFYSKQATVYSQQTLREDPYEYYYLAFYGHACDLLLEKAGFTPKSHVLSLDSDFVCEQMRNIYECFAENSFSSIAKANIHFFQILSFLIERREENRKKIRKSNLLILEQGQIYIENNYSRDLTIEEICRKLYINHSHFSIQFKKLYGVSPKEYLTNYRINRAMFLLQTTDLPIVKIAESVGFNDYTNFFKKFCARVGRPPREYRVENSPPSPEEGGR